MALGGINGGNKYSKDYLAAIENDTFKELTLKAETVTKKYR